MAKSWPYPTKSSAGHGIGSGIGFAIGIGIYGAGRTWKPSCCLRTTCALAL